MSETNTDQLIKPKDRKLGDEWTDWEGDLGLSESEIDENLITFLSLAAGILFVFIALFPFGWYLIKPRIAQVSPFVANLVGWSVIGFTIVFLILVLIESISLLRFRKSLFPYRLTEKFLLFLLPKTIWLGEKFGISKDRVGNSFIKVNNFVTKSYADKLNPDRLLILLPRCLKKEMKSQIISRLNEDAYKILTAGGGEEARRAIRQHQPTLILALACERDLMSGIKDVAEKIPVLAVPNKRPEGPCKNTHVSLKELEEAIEFIKDRKNRKP
jgi:hypothetical protein